jgi:hypothetical protein
MCVAYRDRMRYIHVLYVFVLHALEEKTCSKWSLTTYTQIYTVRAYTHLSDRRFAKRNFSSFSSRLLLVWEQHYEWRFVKDIRDMFDNFMFCWPCISMHACNETNFLHYLSSFYSVTIPLHASDLLVVHQKATMYICKNWYVFYVLGYCRRVRRQSIKTYNTYQLLHIYIVTSW